MVDPQNYYIQETLKDGTPVEFLGERLDEVFSLGVAISHRQIGARNASAQP